MELAISICLGIGLAAACGFRVFVPLLGVSSAALAGQLELASGLEWIGTWPAFACFLTATVLEIGAYYVPWIDNLLDSVTTPAAIAAGTVVTASVVTDMSPLMKWTLALIAGGGTAGLTQSLTVALRGTSLATTGGLGNWLIATLELVVSVGTTVLSLLVPIAGLAVIAAVAIAILLVWRRRRLSYAGKPTAA